MSLFPTRRRYQGRSRSGGPGILRHLNVVCRCRDVHQLPVMMRFIGWTTTRRGTTGAVYACSYRNCIIRAIYVRDFDTGRPRMLWMDRHDGR